MSPALVEAGTAIGLFALVLTGVWSWRKLLRGARSPYGRLVYLFGVRYMGLSTWIVLTVLMAEREFTFTMNYGHRLLMAGVLLFPISPWIGFLWGQTIAEILGASKRPRD
jgi:hypothetical protein